MWTRHTTWFPMYIEASPRRRLSRRPSNMSSWASQQRKSAGMGTSWTVPWRRSRNSFPRSQIKPARLRLVAVNRHGSHEEVRDSSIQEARRYAEPFNPHQSHRVICVSVSCPAIYAS
ncbi:unnamed protein product [Mesocestoides corti]|uniref:Acetyl-CoA carboxylase n=1 Tax=Mesocestoides corti TaxID=53468 RepID=A0A0R3UCL9_MESCO|nr:unnamed protein product [Mesocestoides corti]